MHERFSRRGLLALAAALAAAGSACGGDGGTNPPTPVVTTIDKLASTDGQTATVAGSLPLAPSVTVLDQNGNPMPGITVTFAIATGGGSVTGATPLTNSSGVATVGSWTLGTTAGANTLTASAAGRSATFTATGTPDAPSVLERVEGTDGQTAAAGSTVPLDPAVRVTDTHGNPIEGVEVAFAVAAGSGSVTDGSPMTDASGIAAVGSWTLGTSAGLNELTATTEGIEPLTFSATGTAGAAASMTKNAATDGQSATAGSAVGTPPSVTVTDANGNPVAGVTVTFAVTSGSGSITGASQATSATGVATVGSWTLGTQAGQNQLSASVEGLEAVTFTASGTAGAAASVTKVAGTDEQIGAADEPVAVDPAVVVVDAHGNPVSGVTVTFAVGAGGGSITGATQVSDANGVATVGSWTLGPYNDVNELTATVTGLTPVMFQAAPDPCTVDPPLAVGGSFDGELTEWDCVLGAGYFFDYYTMAPAALTAVEFTVTSTMLDAYFQLYDAAGMARAYDNDDETSTNAKIRVLMPAGSYTPSASSGVAGQQGTYTIGATPIPTSVSGCLITWTMRGVTTTQSLATTDCVNADGPWYSDEYALYMHAGETVTFTMTSTAVNAHLRLFTGSGTFIIDDDDGAGGTNARLTYTATTAGPIILAATAYSSQTGAYTLEIQP